MAPPLARFLASRVLVGGAVAGLLAIPGSRAPSGSAAALLISLVGTTVAAALIGRGWDARRKAIALGAFLVLDLAIESVLVATTGGARSPFVLLYTLSIAATGLFFGLGGGIGVALGATIGYWVGILATRGESGIPATVTSLFLILLGWMAGILGRRASEQRREMERVRGELERVHLDAEAIVESLPQPLLCLDDEGKIRRANVSAIELLGLRPAPEGVRLDEAGNPDRLRPLLDCHREILERGEGPPVEILLSSPDNPRTAPIPIEVLASSVRDRQGSVLGHVLLVSDLTRRKEQETEQTRRERLAVIGELSGHLAHEIRNSLKPIVGSIELLAHEIPSYGIASELSSIILREGETLEKFLSDFLAYSRDKTLTVREVDLDELLRDEIATLSRHPARVRQVVLRNLPGECDGRILTDRDAVRDIARNLLLNALEATGEGEVTVRWLPSDEDGVEIVVEDTGSGLVEGDPDSLFEPFRSYKPGGTGLGLTIARRLARRLGGDVNLERREPRGTRATLYIPGCRSQIGAAAA